MTSATNFKQLESDLVKLLLVHDPVLGTQLGLPGEHDGQLPVSEKAARESLLKDLQQSIDRFSAATTSLWPADDRIDSELAVAGMHNLQIFDSVLRPCERNPDWYLDSALTGIYALLMRLDMATEEKIDYLYTRLTGIPAHLQLGMRQITRPPRVLVETAAGNVQGALAFIQESLGAYITTLPSQASQRKLEQARQLCLEAIQQFSSYIEALAAQSSEDFALGKPAFNSLLKETHKIPYDADDLLGLGYQVAGEIERELEALSLSLTGHTQWWVALEPLSAYHPARESLLDEYRKTLTEAQRFAGEQGLVDLTDVSPLEIKPTPPFARANLPFAAYIPVPPFADSGRAQFWVTPIADDLPTERVENALSQHHPGRILVACVHEAYPGHHVQFSHAFHVRRPLRHIFSSTVFVEGWALYCEDLMRLTGFKRDDPRHGLLQMSQLRDQLWRALRIVLDVGLHCNDMSQAEATELLVNRHVLDADSAAAEVMYYCSAPTQPMSYMVGKLLIEELIKKCQTLATDRFQSLFHIHNQVLAHGALPFSLLERALGLS